MNRPILMSAIFIAATAAAGMQATAQSTRYEGTSRPPSDDQIITSEEPEAKPPAGQPMVSQPAYQAPVQVQSEGQPAPGDFPPSDRFSSNSRSLQTGSDDGIVHVAQSGPALAVRHSAFSNDPDGDIVHPRARRDGEIGEGTTIRVRLLQRLSTTSTEKGEAFRTRVASDVLEGGRVVIPAGAEIDGQVIRVSSGRVGGHGSMRLAPETVTLPDGTRFHLHAEVSGTPGSRARVGREGSIVPSSRLKRDGIEYGAVAGAGLVTGAIVGGPVGAAAGGLIGAGVVTVHLLVSHPQATLESGTTLMLTLTEPLDLVPSVSNGN